MSPNSLVQQAHTALAAILREGDVVIDATVGNGHDTLFLAQQVGESGTVYGFDIQQQALDIAYARLQEAGLERRTSLYHAGHEAMAVVLPQSLAGRLKAVVFNLGYLPGGDKVRTTAIHTTLAALEQARELLAPGGGISVLAYTGHPGGREEAETVKAWAHTLPPDYYKVQITIPPSQSGSAPEWLWIVRV
ncbi:MAG: methyltransferase domain-containing protein [Gammaproteobacteria bacterium]|nr:methyltransferase domain-containing protein [Gammaproteobacteria bacterium]